MISRFPFFEASLSLSRSVQLAIWRSAQRMWFFNDQSSKKSNLWLLFPNSRCQKSDTIGQDKSPNFGTTIKRQYYLYRCIGVVCARNKLITSVFGTRMSSVPPTNSKFLYKLEACLPRIFRMQHLWRVIKCPFVFKTVQICEERWHRFTEI